MIISSIKQYTDDLTNSRFANRILEDKRTLRIGNIISFVAPVNMQTCADECINFMIEIPEISNYAGACFQRLFVTNVANILANTCFPDEQFEVINNDIIIKKEHNNGGISQVDGVVSLNQIKNINGAILIYLGLYNKAGKNSPPRAYSLNLTADKYNPLMDAINESFYHLANSLFLTTAKM